MAPTPSGTRGGTPRGTRGGVLGVPSGFSARVPLGVLGHGGGTPSNEPREEPEGGGRVPLGVPPRGSLGLHGNGVVPGFPARVPHGVLRARRGGRGFLLGFLAGF